jgi:ribosomal protein S27AE
MKWLRRLLGMQCTHEASCDYVDKYITFQSGGGITPVKLRCRKCGEVFMTKHILPKHRDFSK